jgi:hypothetical protein
VASHPHIFCATVIKLQLPLSGLCAKDQSISNQYQHTLYLPQSDVVERKINVPTAIFSGKHTNSFAAQRWMY